MGRGGVDTEFVVAAAAVEVDLLPGARVVAAGEAVCAGAGVVDAVRYEEVGTRGAVVEEAGGAFGEVVLRGVGVENGDDGG